MKPLLFCASLLLITLGQGNAQLLQNLKKVATDKAKNVGKENLQRVGQSIAGDLQKMRDQFDSADFDYAILLNENAGHFDVREKGETASKLITLANMGNAITNNANLSGNDKARFQLEMGEFAYASRRYAYAEKRFASARALYEQEGLTREIGYLKTLANQGLLYSTMGRYTQSEELTVKALGLRKEYFGEKDISIAASLNNYGVLQVSLARYHEGETLFNQALSLLEFNQAQGTMPYAIALNNEAMLYQLIGRYNEAEALMKKAISVAEKLQSSKSKNHLKFLSNLALLYQQSGKYGEAETIYLTMEKRLVKSSPEYAGMLTGLASLYLVMGKETQVEEPLKKAIALYASNFGESHPSYADAASDLGNFYRYKERYGEAGPLLEKALVSKEKNLGTSHPQYIQSQEDLAILYWKKKEMDKAYTTYRGVMDKTLDFVNHYFPPMSESEKAKFWDVVHPRFQRFYNFALELGPQNENVLADLFDYEMATKALLLNTTNRIKQTILASKDNALIRDYLTWLDQKENLARLYAYSKGELAEQKINLDSIERAANNLERSLSERSKDFTKGYMAQRVGYAQIQKTLAEQEALVEIIRIRKFAQKFTDESSYAALVLRAGKPKPRLVVLDNGNALETRYAKFYRNAIQQRVPDGYSYDQYWSRIEPELTGIKMIYFCPDGVYSQINLNTLKSPANDYFINRYDLAIVGNPRDLLSFKQKKATLPGKNAIMLGFPDYGGSQVAALPGTKKEIESIGKMLTVSGYKLANYMQKTATETNLKSVKEPTLLHIATHGYFLKDVEGSEGSVFGVHLQNAQDNPLLRSGLLLAGAATTLAGSEPNLTSNDNGVLTAYEAMNLNLENTNLIILSACETGLGDVKAGEGVYGLQRAFLVAGADAMIMSLWKVDDAATQQLMTNFYTNWIKSGNKQKAFKQAQLQLMSTYKDPYFWGAFVMMGL